MIHDVPSPSLISSGLLLVLVLIGGIYDFRFRRLPNWLTVGGTALGFLINLQILKGAGLGNAATGLGLAMLIYVPLYLLRAMGAGDVKLMAAIGAIVGPTNWLVIFLATALVGGVLALWLSAAKGRIRQVLFNVSFMVFELAHFRAPYRTNSALDVHCEAALRMPHGVSTAVGALLSLVWMRGVSGGVLL
jgi:prepilin peptidase CpaA